MLKQEKRQRKGASLSSALSLGFDIAVGVGIFAFGGYWLDQKRGGGIGWTLAGMCLGFIYAGYEIWRTLRVIQEDDRSQKEGGGASEAQDPKGP